MDAMVQILIATVTPPAINSPEAITTNLLGHNRDWILVLGCSDEIPWGVDTGTEWVGHHLQAEQPLI